MEKIYLQVGGFNILLEIGDSERKFPKEQFIKMLLYDYSEFIIRKPKKTHFVFKIYTSRYIHLEEKEADNTFDNYHTHFFSIKRNGNWGFINIPPSHLEFEFIITFIINKYLIWKTKSFTLHGSSVVFKDKIFIFEGVSGAGKSTTAKLLEGLCETFSDDEMIIRELNGDIFAFQTINHAKNWNFKRTKESFGINSIFFIKKSKNCYVKKIENKDIALKKILKQVFTESIDLKTQFILISDFVNKNRFYELGVKKDSKIFKQFFKKEILKI